MTIYDELFCIFWPVLQLSVICYVIFRNNNTKEIKNGNQIGDTII